MALHEGPPTRTTPCSCVCVCVRNNAALSRRQSRKICWICWAPYVWLRQLAVTGTADCMHLRMCWVVRRSTNKQAELFCTHTHTYTVTCTHTRARARTHHTRIIHSYCQQRLICLHTVSRTNTSRAHACRSNNVRPRFKARQRCSVTLVVCW